MPRLTWMTADITPFLVTLRAPGGAAADAGEAVPGSERSVQRLIQSVIGNREAALAARLKSERALGLAGAHGNREGPDNLGSRARRGLQRLVRDLAGKDLLFIMAKFNVCFVHGIDPFYGKANMGVSNESLFPH
jgi:hypothetical protein